MSNLIKQLRAAAAIYTFGSNSPDEHIAGIAADRIEKLQAQLDGMECYRVWGFGHDEDCNIQTDDVVAWCPVCRSKAALDKGE